MSRCVICDFILYINDMNVIFLYLIRIDICVEFLFFLFYLFIALEKSILRYFKDNF